MTAATGVATFSSFMIAGLLLASFVGIAIASFAGGVVIGLRSVVCSLLLFVKAIKVAIVATDTIVNATDTFPMAEEKNE